MRKNKILTIGLGSVIILLIFNTGCLDGDDSKSRYISWGELMDDYENNGFKSYEPGDKLEIKDDILDISGDANKLYIDFESTSKSENTLGEYDILVIDLSNEEMDNIDTGCIKFYLNIETRKDFDDKSYEWFVEAGNIGDWLFCFEINIEKG